MNNIEYATGFIKAFNKYLIISWAVFIVGFSIYWFGFGTILKRDPSLAFAEGEEGEEIEYVEDVAPEPIEDTAPEPEQPQQYEQSTTQEIETVEDAAPEPLSEPDAVIEESAQNQPQEVEYVDGSAPVEPLADTASPDVSVITEEQPEQPSATYQPPPERIVEREVIREVVRHEKEDRDRGDGDDNDRDRETPIPTPTPGPSPLPSPSPSAAVPTVSLTLTENVCVPGRGNLVRFSFSSNSADVRTFYLDKNGQSVSATAGNNPTVQIQINQGEMANFSARVQTGAGTFGGSNTVSVTGAACASPSPSPFPSPSPSVTILPSSSPNPSPTATAVVGNQVVDGVIREIPAGAPDNTCPYQVRAVITRTRTICDPQALEAARGQQVLAAVATPTPIPTPVAVAQAASLSPRTNPSPSPIVAVVQTPTPSPSPRISPSPSATPIVLIVQASPSPTATPQVQVVARNDSITIPTRQDIACPSGSRRIDRGSQIICEVTIPQGQILAQAQTQTPAQPQQVQKVVVNEATPAAVASAAPKVIAQAQTPATVLPNTGLPAAALGFGSLIPLGLGLRKWKNGAGNGVSPNSVWLERQLKA